MIEDQKISKDGFWDHDDTFCYYYLFLYLSLKWQYKTKHQINIKNVTWISRKTKDNEILQYTCTYCLIEKHGEWSFEKAIKHYHHYDAEEKSRYVE